MPAPMNVELAYYKAVAEWHPQVGDYVVWHGWLTHWFGIVRQIDQDGSLHVMKQGIPILLFSLSNNEPAMDENTVKIHSAEIRNSSGGRYAVIQAAGNNIVWFV